MPPVASGSLNTFKTAPCSFMYAQGLFCRRHRLYKNAACSPARRYCRSRDFPTPMCLEDFSTMYYRVFCAASLIIRPCYLIWRCVSWQEKEGIDLYVTNELNYDSIEQRLLGKRGSKTSFQSHGRQCPTVRNAGVNR